MPGLPVQRQQPGAHCSRVQPTGRLTDKPQVPPPPPPQSIMVYLPQIIPVWKSLKQGHKYCHSVFGIQHMWCLEQSRHVWQRCTWANHFLVFTGKEAAPWGAHIWSKEEFLLYKYHQNHRMKSTNDDICIFSGQLASSPASSLLLMRTPPPPPPPPSLYKV